MVLVRMKRHYDACVAEKVLSKNIVKLGNLLQYFCDGIKCVRVCVCACVLYIVVLP